MVLGAIQTIQAIVSEVPFTLLERASLCFSVCRIVCARWLITTVIASLLRQLEKGCEVATILVSAPKLLSQNFRWANRCDFCCYSLLDAHLRSIHNFVFSR